MEFNEALARVRDGGRTADGIGTLGEKTIHATLKWWLDDDATHHEVTLPCGSVADIYDGERVIEIQTANYSGFRKKLERLLADHPVTVVCPLVHRKRVVWIDPATGETAPPNRSPRRGWFSDMLPHLVYILPLLDHPRLTLRPVLLDVEEHRLADGWGNGGKRGSHRAERYPTALVDTVTVESGEDYRRLLPSGLPHEFTATEFGKIARLQGRRLSGALKVLLTVGVLTREREGRGYRYTITGEWNCEE